jgi:DNA-binding CsgD family transcriptional regulator
VAVLLETGAAGDPRARLSAAEVKVLDKMSLGLSNREIAAALFVSVETVRTHVKHILAKLDVRTRTQAVAMALKRGG